MKFKLTSWRDMKPSPFHEGEYEVALIDGHVARAEFRNGQWAEDPAGFVKWRGLQLKSLKKPKAHRRSMGDYSLADAKTHGPAFKGALFMARRAVSLADDFDGYRYYAIAHAIAPDQLEDVDKGWIRRFSEEGARSKAKLDAEHRKADRFFEKRGGRPASAA